jgi:sporulation protein YlmC with PRC-barrel domain
VFSRQPRIERRAPEGRNSPPRRVLSSVILEQEDRHGFKISRRGLHGRRIDGHSCFCTNASHHSHGRADIPAAATSFQGDWRTSKVVGLKIYNDNGNSLGSIEDLLTDKDGTIKAVVIGVGSFLGVGEHLVAVPFDQISSSTSRFPQPAPLAQATLPTDRCRRPPQVLQPQIRCQPVQLRQ